MHILRLGVLATILSLSLTLRAAELDPLVTGEVARAEQLNGNFQRLNEDTLTNAAAIATLRTDVDTIELIPGPAGPMGLPGPTGATGPAGPTGPQGPPGMDADMTLVSQNSADIADALARIGALEMSGGGTGAAVLQSFPQISVDCDAGESLQQAIANAPLGVGTISFSGTCNEPLFIDRDGLRILGTGVEPTVTRGVVVRNSGLTNLESFRIEVTQFDASIPSVYGMIVLDYSRVLAASVDIVVEAISASTAVSVVSSRLLFYGGSIAITTTDGEAVGVAASSSSTLILGGAGISADAPLKATAAEVSTGSLLLNAPVGGSFDPDSSLITTGAPERVALQIAGATLISQVGSLLTLDGDLRFASALGLVAGGLNQTAGRVSIRGASALALASDVVSPAELLLEDGTLIVTDVTTGLSVDAARNASVVLERTTMTGSVDLALGAVLDVKDNSVLDALTVSGTGSDYRVDATSSITSLP